MTTTQIHSTEITQIENENYDYYLPRFDSERKLRLLILSHMKLKKGELWKLSINHEIHRELLIYVTDVFSAIAGDIENYSPLVGELLDKMKRHTMLLVENDKQVEILRHHFGFRFIAKENSRYSFDQNELSVSKLQELRQYYAEKHQGSAIMIRPSSDSDREHISDELMQYFDIFHDRTSLVSSGLTHVAVTESGRVVSIAAAAHEPIRNHYEIQVATEREYRKQGLSMRTSIDHLLWALERGYYPHWDAASQVSAMLAEKLGYGPRQGYPIYAYTTRLFQILLKSRIPKLVVRLLRKFGKLQD